MYVYIYIYIYIYLFITTTNNNSNNDDILIVQFIRPWRIHEGDFAVVAAAPDGRAAAEALGVSRSPLKWARWFSLWQYILHSRSLQ